ISSLRTTPPPPRSTLFPYTTLFRSTGFDAERTGAALIRDFFAVVFQFEIQQQFADENPRTVILCDQVCMFAYPAESGASGPCSVHHWLNIDADLTFCFRPLLFNPFQEFAQPIADDFVIIVAPGVTRYLAGSWTVLVANPPATAGGTNFVLVVGVVIQSDNHDRAGFGK